MNIKRMFARNGYSNNFLDRCIQQFLNRNAVSRNNAMHRLNPLLHPNIFHYNYRIWVLYLITYDRKSAAL